MSCIKWSKGSIRLEEIDTNLRYKSRQDRVSESLLFGLDGGVGASHFRRVDRVAGRKDVVEEGGVVAGAPVVLGRTPAVVIRRQAPIVIAAKLKILHTGC